MLGMELTDEQWTRIEPLITSLKVTVISNSFIDNKSQCGNSKPCELREIMQALKKKIIVAAAVILLSWVLVCGIAFAKQGCYKINLDDYLSPSGRTSFGHTSINFDKISLLHQRESLQNKTTSFKDCLADFDDENTCCFTNRCGSYRQTSYHSFSFTQDYYSFKKIPSSFIVIVGTQNQILSKKLSSSSKAIPIYIFTQSIIC
jgi:hypothetical protein